MINRRSFLRSSAAVALISPFTGHADEELPLVQVWKSPTCGCCSKWVDHMRHAGFKVETTNVPDVNVYKQKYGLPPQLASCHTAVVAGYVVEGHVPASDVQRLLKLRPEVTGIAVPGMPLGSPGMEAPSPQAYEVVSFSTDGEAAVFATHTPPYSY